MNDNERRLRALDARVVQAARGIRVLTHLAWPVELGEVFIEQWKAGRPEIPRVQYPRADLSLASAELSGVMRECDRKHPLEDFVFRTARSYHQAVALLDAVGTAAFTARSRTLYGDSTQPVTGEGPTTAVAAAKVMELTAQYVDDRRIEATEYCVLPAAVARQIESAATLFDRDAVEVVLDPALSSKAAAGARRVRVRSSTCFSEADVPQLIQHELLVHTLTALNGRVQPLLTCMSLGAPRTTRTQEGLALFAELITNSMDIHRLRRIAARVVAIDMALDGADFIDLFRYFLAAGQTEHESFASAQRIFRGTDGRGGSAFTKDGVYFQGLVRVHRFLRDAARAGQAADPGFLMAGRMRFDDVERLRPWFESGAIVAPRYLPDWIRHRSRLVTFLMYSSFAAELHLDSALALAEATEGGD